MSANGSKDRTTMEGASPSPRGWNQDLEKAEAHKIHQRRKAAGIPTAAVTEDSLPVDTVGVALSGGGIRSATFCLGIFQGLAQRGLLPRIDYLSTVSGGGYFGGFYGRMFTRDWATMGDPEVRKGTTAKVSDRLQNTVGFCEQVKELSRLERVEQALQDNDSPPVRWLRQCGNYMSPKGTGGAALAAAVFTRNWLSVLLVLLVTVLTLLLAGNLVRGLADSWHRFHDLEILLASFAGAHWWWSPWVIVPGLILVFAVIPLFVTYWLSQAGDGRQFFLVASANLFAVGFGAAVFLGCGHTLIALVSAGAGLIAVLGLIWLIGLGASRCFHPQHRELLPRLPMVASILMMMVCSMGWFYCLGKKLNLGVSAFAALLALGTLWNLSLRAWRKANPHVPPGSGGAGRWCGSWGVGRWAAVGGMDMGFALGVASVAIGYALCLGLGVAEGLLESLYPVWVGGIVIVVLAGVYRLGFQVLEHDLEILKDQGNQDRRKDYVGIVPWLRNMSSRWLSQSLIWFGIALAIAVIDSLGQSLYAIVAYEGGGAHLVSALVGMLGLAGLGAFGRNLVLLLGKKDSGWNLPIQGTTLVIGGLLAFCLLLGVDVVSHGIAWRGRSPQPSAPGVTVGPYRDLGELWIRRLKDDWTPDAPSPVLAEDPPVSPGPKLYQHLFVAPQVFLSDDKLIGIRPPSAEGEIREGRSQMALPDLLLACFLAALLTILFGKTTSFLNLSSFHSFYSARLIRAYQGASNLHRRMTDTGGVNDVHPRDDILWADYQPHLHGGPLHLVNVALNCTTRLETGMQSDSAKGLNLCCGPAGLSFGSQNFLFPPNSSRQVLRFPADPKPIEVEALSLGGWVGVSGAAFTTGMGNVGGGTGTGFGTSLVCGLFNIRLGYWWKNSFSPSKQLSLDAILPVQGYIRDELFGEFSVTAKDRWYLSDGGHFENTAAYELIRRRVPFILLSDAGADPEGQLEDLANLVRRVRLDFDAEVVFLTDDELVKELDPAFLSPAVKQRMGLSPTGPVSWIGKIGTLDDLQPTRAKEREPWRVRANATLARVYYRREAAAGQARPPSLLLIVKPGMTEGLNADLLVYQRANPDFPQQTTLDQFFDEAQWESYRKLGESLAMALFAEPNVVHPELRCPRQYFFPAAPSPVGVSGQRESKFVSPGKLHEP